MEMPVVYWRSESYLEHWNKLSFHPHQAW